LAFAAPSADPAAALPAPVLDPIWLDPIPDEALDLDAPTPEARVDTRESVSLAFLALLQTLPGEQRAVLLLRDVLGWRAQDVADTLELSVAAVNSALQRARVTIKKKQAEAAFKPWQRADARAHSGLLKAYVQAWESADLASLLRNDATLTMPPLPAWFAGREAILAFYRAQLLRPGMAGQYRLLPVHANGQPAFAVYQRAADGVYRAAAIQVVVLADGQIGQVHSFLALDDKLFRRFGLPAAI
jgi:RNA polymerase sigma-70 factor (ECF subfamily)